jgi:RNA polymerase sigma-70 factor (ECF subfamily)
MALRLNDRSSDIVADVQSGSVPALEALYHRYASLVARVAYRITGSRDEADDVVQDVFIGLPEALRRFDGRGSLDAWIHRVATRAALMRVRQTRRHMPLDSTSEPRTRSPDSLAKIALDAALEKLPEPLRLVFVLKEMEGYSHAEIADLLGIRTGTSEVRLFRATRRLRALLET